VPDPAVGIDLGTTFSVVAHLDSDGRPWTILNAEGDLTTPSIVFFDKSGAIVGKEAAQAGEYEPDRIAQFAKRDMGESEFSKAIRGKQLPPEVVQAVVLRKLKSDAELKLGEFTKAVVTVPAFFNEPCRKATQDAGRLAGLEVLDIINEPTAAAICYGVQQGFLNSDGESTGKELILIYDLGGGTFDVTLMEIDGAKYKALATGGDVYLGGVDFDRRIVDYMAEEFEMEYDVDPRKDDSAYQVLLQKAAEAKHALSARDEMSIFFAHEGNRHRINLTREKFEFLTEDLIDRTILTTNKVLREASVEYSDLTRLMLVGGSTRMPKVQEILEKETGLKADRSLSPDEAVAHGAAIYAGLILKTGGDRITGMSVTNVSSHDLGILGKEQATGRNRRSVMIPKNTSLPVKARKKFSTFRDNQTSVEVNVIEGGDDSGNNSTPIGRCIIDGLPSGLPAKTPIEVIFKYQANGRMKVAAKLPSINKDASLTIQRAAGLDQETIDKWSDLVAQGLPDGVDTA
jgi:molecular chaperone DnaK